MKIVGVETIVLKCKVENPLGGSQFTYGVGGHLLVRLHTDDGLVGNATSYFGRIESGMATVKKIIDRELAPVLIGQDPHFVRRIRHDMAAATEYYGTAGVAAFAISALDIALWDIIGQAAGLPVAKILGARHSAIPSYAMVGWYYQGGLSEFVKNCREAVEEGFRAIKIKVGRGSLRDDLERIRALRSEFGEDFRVMVDANCAFDEMEALRRGYAYQEENVYWFEEPMQPHFLESHARLRQKLRIPIAIGENYYTRFQFYQVIRMGCADVIQPDNRRAGGATEWMDIAAISEAAGLGLASHLGGPGNVNVMCAIDNAVYLECEGLKKDNEMLVNPLVMKDGMIRMPEAPGMGTAVREDYIRKYRISD